MRVLVLGADTPLGQALEKYLVTQGRHELVLMTRSNCRWKSERQAKKIVRRASADIVVDIRIDAAADGSEQIHESDIQRCHWVSKACQRNKIAYLYLSSSRVFSGMRDLPYTEDDVPDNTETLGQLLAAGEEAVRYSCERHLILRLGPIFSKQSPNLVTEMLGEMMEGRELTLDNNLRGCPVSAHDGARVISALLDQIGTGVEAWGTYHYCSSDTATYYEFAEALLAAASQFSEFSSSAVQLQQLPEGRPPLNRVLDCDKLRNTFAVKQVPWRSTIADIVKQYYAEQD